MERNSLELLVGLVKLVEAHMAFLLSGQISREWSRSRGRISAIEGVLIGTDSVESFVSIGHRSTLVVFDTPLIGSKPPGYRKNWIRSARTSSTRAARLRRRYLRNQVSRRLSLPRKVEEAASAPHGKGRRHPARYTQSGVFLELPFCGFRGGVWGIS